MVLRWIVGWCLTLSAGCALAAGVVGRVVNVHDGDTLTLLVDHRQVRVRLVDIDAPELGQAFGKRSRESLAQMCAGQTAVVRDGGRDRYKRMLGRVTCAGIDANAAQVKRGMAWVFDRYVRDRSLYALQREALTEQRGLWADAHPVPPWDWRISARTKPR